MYSEQQINAAIARVETAKQDRPQGWAFLDRLGLDPADSYVFYAFQNGPAHEQRLAFEDDPALLYAAAWLNGLAVGHELGKGTE
jgi:hypothetical protein